MCDHQNALAMLSGNNLLQGGHRTIHGRGRRFSSWEVMSNRVHAESGTRFGELRLHFLIGEPLPEAKVEFDQIW